MTPTEHYRLADDLLKMLREDNGTARQLTEYQQERIVARAQVHATLANAHMTAGVWDERESVMLRGDDGSTYPAPRRSERLCANTGCLLLAGHTGRHKGQP